ncbi:MAG: nucleotidyltransferase domain-containing protein [Spirochaetales bacterium]|nr:nucleotidyltransferase domain-containing protein [Spirochaetales bacterium]
MDAAETVRGFENHKKDTLEKEALARRRYFETQLPVLTAGILRIAPETEKIILFGSLAREQELQVRDIDLALVCSQFYRAAAWLLKQDVPVDVVDLEDVYPHIRERIMAEGRILYEKD